MVVEVSWKVATSIQNNHCIRASTVTLITSFRVFSQNFNINQTDREVTLTHQFESLNWFDAETIQVRVDVMGDGTRADNYVVKTVDVPIRGNNCGI